MDGRPQLERSMGLAAATSLGVGAIVGGGILALAGVAFVATGPGAILAFALNGVIALVTALSFAELATRFPESGGTYSFARKVLSIETAFTVGWVVWFASIVAAVLYAFGFGAFLVLAIGDVWTARAGAAPAWLGGGTPVTLLACAATAVLALGLLRKRGGGGPWLNVGKLAVFAVLVAAGLWKLAGEPRAAVRDDLVPFLPAGAMGLVQAMGFTFIAMQGFDLIAAVGGEVRDPRRTIPRAMLLSLGIALAVYLPLLLIVATVGTPPGQTVAAASAGRPEAIVADAARNFLGGFGYWLVIAAAILSMLSALQANLLAASRVALAMARDRTLPPWLEGVSTKHGTPQAAVVVTATVVVLVLVAVPDVAAAGAASSLVFLLTFALVHRITTIARRRAVNDDNVFRVPGFPVVPLLGGAACLALAVFQGFVVPSAGLVACAWLALGGAFYTFVLARRARRVDAFTQAIDADLVRLRGRSPLVLVPVANPASAEAMVAVANAMAPPLVGRVLLLTIVAPPAGADVPETDALATVQGVLREGLTASFARGLRPEVLATVAPSPWPEIERVARVHRCESLVLGFNRLTDPFGDQLEKVMSRVACEVVVLRAPAGWRLIDVRRVLVPIAGRGGHDVLRARLLGSIHRLGAREITLLTVVPETAGERDRAQARAALARIARDEVPHGATIVVAASDRPGEVIAQHAEENDLVVLGLQRASRRRKSFGPVALGLADHSSCALVMISRRG